MKICKRCGKSFEPRYLDALKTMSTHCDTCGVRNIFDGLGFHTPPCLLDKHTKKPTLTESEFRIKLHKK